jgi:hypothetical protein
MLLILFSILYLLIIQTFDNKITEILVTLLNKSLINSTLRIMWKERVIFTLIRKWPQLHDYYVGFLMVAGMIF